MGHLLTKFSSRVKFPAKEVLDLLVVRKLAREGGDRVAESGDLEVDGSSHSLLSELAGLLCFFKEKIHLCFGVGKV